MRSRWMLVCAGLALLAPCAQAQNAVVGGWGPRFGFSSGPDQIVFGGQLIIGEIAPDITFDPSLELGFGDDMTVIALNLDGHYHVSVRGSRWRPYAGAGVAISFVSLDESPGNDDSDTEVGGALIVGAGVPTAAGNRFFTELKLGLGDVPDFKLMAGWNFRM